MIKQYEEIFGETPNAITPRPFAEEKMCFLKMKNPKYVKTQTKEEILLAQKEKHDGIILLNINDSKEIFELAVFESEQIKLADGTNITFDGNNPDIRFNDGGQIPKIVISHSFINSKGNKVDQYKLTDGYGGYIRVEHYSDGFVITNIILDERLRRKGLATEFYKKINEESIKETGKTLQSIKRDSDGIIELSDNGKNLWESLVKRGLAIKISKNKYRFKK
jgi:hypothetical protein